jgi:flagellar biogenesis protein FliO
MFQFLPRRCWHAAAWLVVLSWPRLVSAESPALPTPTDPHAYQLEAAQATLSTTSDAEHGARPSSVYAKQLASRQHVVAQNDSETASGVAPILAAELDYSPPPALPAETSQQEPSRIHDPHVVVATHELGPVETPRFDSALPATEDDQRRLFTPASRAERGDERGGHQLPQLPALPMGAVVTAVGATSAVAGLFLLSVYALRRGLPRGASTLPDDVVCVLGRKQLSTRQSAQLIRVGNKLVLLSVTPDGVEPLAEVTDPAEVDRLLGLCHQSSEASSTGEFQDVMDQLARERGSSGFLGSQSIAGDAYLAHLGGRGNG